MDAHKIPDNDDEMWDVVISGAADTLDHLQANFKGNPQMGLAAIALAMSYLLTMSKTPQDRRQALYDCIEERVNDTTTPLTPEREALMFHVSHDSKVVH